MNVHCTVVWVRVFYGISSWRTAVLPGREPVHLKEDHLGEQLFYLEESQFILLKIILENSCFTWKRASSSYWRSSWRTAVLPGRELAHLMEYHLGEQLFYLEESQCILWKIILENSCFTWKRASASYWKIILGNPVLPGREPMHLMENHFGEPCKDDEHSDH